MTTAFGTSTLIHLGRSQLSCCFKSRRDGRVAEGDGLLNRAIRPETRRNPQNVPNDRPRKRPFFPWFWDSLFYPRSWILGRLAHNPKICMPIQLGECEG